MKNLLLLPLVLLSLCVFADERVFLRSLVQESTESVVAERGIDAESSLTGIEARFYNFRDRGINSGARFAHLTDALDICQPPLCRAANASRTRFYSEIGRDLSQWTPLIDMSVAGSVADSSKESDSDETWGINAGVWFENETLKLRGALTDVGDSDNREIFGNFLFKFGNNYVFGAEGGLLLNEAEDRFSVSLQIGKVFF
ncbi:MAG: hypothetical protein F4227_03065 [Gammaproteobacteria bacterium]|nr:hypothetical protein [Gammaproteobacteria bacterium]MYF01976.1 hypothetical protein [Gammaproteobacteria bacterium]MYI76825.1 hypothetical protein [Gammaproteobacteria bacterium]